MTEYVPGEWECPECGFTLQKNFLYAQTGAVGVNDEEVREVCPNDGVTLQRLTWKRQAEAAYRVAVEGLEREKRFREVLQAVVDVDPDPCWLDHHGNCQAHYLGNPCHIAEAKKLLGEGVSR
jgi:predicted RNA-binding Zn-ribbon protein involved in translation (DUF1610 family)